MAQAVKHRSEYTYRCKYCGFENFSTQIDELAPAGLSGTAGVSITNLGNYGNNATPAPAQDTVTVYTSTSLSFTAASGDVYAKLSDSMNRFTDKHIKPGWGITIVTESGTNNGSYTIADKGVNRSEISVTDDDPSYLMIAGEYVMVNGEYVIVGDSVGFTTETAATAGQVTIKKIIYVPEITTGCYFCGTLNSK
jgi:hypothetical protein